MKVASEPKKSDGQKTVNPADKAAPEFLEQRILILALTGNDAVLTAQFLGKENLSTHVCRDVPHLCAEVARGCGMILLAEETLAQRSISLLVATLGTQPPWSDIPIILITSGGEISQSRMRRLTAFGPGGNVTLLERPFRPATLISAAEVALRSRKRQYEARQSVEKLKRAHDEIQAASRAKDDFLAALSHELRTPLNPALLIASESANDNTLPEGARLNFETIRKHIELEARLIDDLLDLTHITAGKMVLNKDVVNVHAILNDALEAVQTERQVKNIRIALKTSAENSLTEGDAVRLQQVFWNVLKNAVKFTPRDGKISIKTKTDNDRLIVKVTDTGIGMSAAEIARVFNAFAQGDHAGTGSSHRFGGLGLGLAISKNLVELHSGKILAHSDGKGCGSTFIIELPLVKKTSAVRNGKMLPDGRHDVAVAENGAAPISVLLVEDHEVTRNVLAQLLTRRNYKVTTAESLAEARKLARQNKFDLLISDIGLPDGNGNELMKEFHASYGLKGIALTGYGMEEDIARGKAAGFVTHLVKPVRIQSLESALTLVKFEP